MTAIHENVLDKSWHRIRWDDNTVINYFTVA